VKSDHKILTFLFILALAASISAQPTGYDYRKKLIISSTQVGGTSDLVDFPVLISLTHNDLRSTGNGGGVANPSGYDIIFTSSDGSTLLDHEMEKYSSTTGEYISWVRIPALSSTLDTEIYLYFGNSTIFSDQSVNTTWNSNYLAVWHFNNGITDASSNGRVLVDNGTAASSTGKIAGAREFAGNGDDLGDASSSAYLDGMTALTISLWAKADVTGTDKGLIFGDIPTGTEDRLGIRYDAAATSSGGTNIIHTSLKTGNNNKVRLESSGGVQTTNWQQIVTSWTETNPMVLYLDGALDTPGYTTSKAGLTSGSSNLYIGKGSRDGTTSSWDGLIDEVRISNIARSADWLSTEYNTSNDPATFFTVSAVNEAPVLAGIETVDLNYAAGSGAVNITMSITTSDYSDLNLSSAHVAITANYLNTEDVLGFNDQNGITGSWNSTTGILSLSGSASQADYQTALRAVTYSNTNATPSTALRTISFTVNDGSADSNTLTRNISLSFTNAAPVLANLETADLDYTDGGSPIMLSSTLTVSDADDAYLESATVELTTNYINGEDLLSFTNTASISGSWNSSSGLLTLTGTAAIADYQIALRGVTYSNSNPDPSTVIRTFAITVNDGTDASNTETRDITVTSVNDAPTLSAIETSPLTYNPGDGAVQITTTIVPADGDNINLSGATVQITGNYFSGEDVLAFSDQLGITGSWDNITGTLTLTGATTISNYQTALRAVTYENTNATPAYSTRTVSFIVNDGTYDSTPATRNIAWGTPGTITDLQLWLRSDVGVYSDAGITAAIEGESAVQWNDQSGNDRHFTSGLKKPVFRSAAATLNNTAALEFIGNKDSFTDDDGELYINGMTEFTTFAVINSDVTGTDNGFIIASAPSGVDQYFTIRYDAIGDIGAASNVIRTSVISNITTNQLESAADFQSTSGQIIEWEWQSGNEYNLYVDGVLNNPSASGSPPSGTISSATELTIGRGSQNNNDSWDGLIAEIIIYDRLLSSSERISVEDYLSQKYGISVRLLDPATGGEAISADDVNTTFTALSGPRITEDVIGELNLNGTIILNAPTGYEWDTGATPTVTINPAFGTATTLAVSYTSITASQVTFTVSAESSTPDKPGEVIFGNLQVRPTTGGLPNTGNITNVGTTGPSGDTNFGTLTMVHGTAAKLSFAQSPVNTNISEIITPYPTIQVNDQYDNAVDTIAINIVITFTTGTGNLGGTTTQATDAAGLATFNNLTVDATGVKRITASSGLLTAIESADFSILSLGEFTTFLVERESGGDILTHTAGEAFNIKISAVDGTQTLDASFTGTVDITSNGTLGTGSGTTASFTGGILASHTVSITNTGNFNITATNSSGTETGNSNSFTVNPGTADPTTTTITADPTILVNDGSSTSAITVQVKDDQGNNLPSGGASVNLITDAGTLLGSIVDQGDGTYTQSLQSSLNIETATITGVLNAVSISDNATVMFNQYNTEWESSLGGETYTSEWEDVRNWSNGVPTLTDIVYIPADPAVGTKQPVIQVDNQSIECIVIEAGADVTLSGGISFEISADVNGSGEFNGSASDSIIIGGDLNLGSVALGYVLLNGTAAQSLTAPSTFTNLVVNNSTGVTAGGNLAVTGTLYLENGNLLIPSGNTLIANTKSVVSGNLRMQREIVGSTGWRLLAAPLVSNYGDFLDAIFTQGYTGSDSATGSPSVLYYDETSAGTDNQRWRKPGADTDVTVPGRGLFTYVFGDITGEPAYSAPLPSLLDIIGLESDGVAGEFDFGISYTTTADSGWNLVGNPFAATIDWDDLSWVKTNVDNTIYLWDTSINSGNGGYLTWNGTTGSLGNGLIPPFQGFWVKANNPSPVLKVNQSAKTTGGVFYKQLVDVNPIIMFRAENDSLEATTYIIFSSDARRNKDPRDAYRLIPFTNTFVDIYTISRDYTQLTINNYPQNFGIPIDIPLDVKAYHDGQSTKMTSSISWPKFVNIPADWTVELYDKQEKITINLRENSIYNFAEEGVEEVLPPVTPGKISHMGPLKLKKTQAGHTARFLVKINPGNSNPDIPSAFALGKNFPNPFNMGTSIPIELPVEGRITLKIINLQGREIATLIADQHYRAGIHHFNWNPTLLASGIYFAYLVTEQKTFISKMMLIK